MRTIMASPADVDGLADRGVLLIGDGRPCNANFWAVKGANTAIKDGVDLAEHIAVQRTSRNQKVFFCHEIRCVEKGCRGERDESGGDAFATHVVLGRIIFALLSETKMTQSYGVLKGQREGNFSL